MVKTASGSRSQLKTVDTENKPIPISARFNGPGPAAYSIPGSIGSYSRVVRHSPSYSFGIKPKEFDRKDSSPGPNAFYPTQTRNGRTSGPAWTLSGRHEKILDFTNKKAATGQENSLSSTPGPGAIPPPHVYKGHTPPAFSISGRSKTKIESSSPSPAAYTIPAAVGYSQPVLSNAPAFTITSPPKISNVQSDSPGPAAYNPAPPVVVKPAAPAFSLGIKGTSISSSSLAKEPGPGSYSPEAYDRILRESKGFTFGVKHSEYTYFVPEEPMDANFTGVMV